MTCLQIHPSCHKEKRHKVPGRRLWVVKAHPGLWWHWCSDINWTNGLFTTTSIPNTSKYSSYVDLVQHHLIFQGKLGMIWVFQWSKRLLWFLWDQNCFHQCDAWFACKMAPHSSIHEKINSKNTQTVPCLKILKGSVLNPLMSCSWLSRARHVMSWHVMTHQRGRESASLRMSLIVNHLFLLCPAGIILQNEDSQPLLRSYVTSSLG